MDCEVVCKFLDKEQRSVCDGDVVYRYMGSPQRARLKGSMHEC